MKSNVIKIGLIGLMSILSLIMSGESVDGAVEAARESGRQNGVTAEISAEDPAIDTIPMSEKLTFTGRAGPTSGTIEVKISASVEPLTAADKSLDWSCYWSNGGYGWAEGKAVSDYITVTPTSDGAVTATVTCYQAFDAPIVIEARSRQNPQAVATCEVNYLVRDYETTMSWIYDDGQYDVEFIGADELQYIPLGEFSSFNDWTQPAEILYGEVKTGTGTKIPGIESREVYIRLSEGFSVALADEGIGAYEKEEEWLSLYAEELYVLLEKICGQYYFFDYPMGEPNEGNWQKFLTAVGNNKSEYDFELKIVSNQTDGTAHETVYRCLFSRNSPGLKTEGVTISPSEIEI